MNMQSHHNEEHFNQEISLTHILNDSGIALTKRGQFLSANCPFHDDQAHSLILDPTTNHWQCDVCSIGGSVVEWIMRAQGVSKSHALALLSDGTKLVAPVNNAPPVRSSIRRLDNLFDSSSDRAQIVSSALHYYCETLKTASDAQEYLDTRKILSAECAEKFKMGFCDRSLPYHLPTANRKEGAFFRGVLREAGLLKPSGHELFRGSIIVQINNNLHAVPNQVYGRKIGKRLRPNADVHTFLPGDVQGILNFEAIQVSDEVILCQSVIDALTFWCAGFLNVTCVYGLSHSPSEVLSAFERYNTKRVLIAFRASQEGDLAAQAIASQLLEKGVDTYQISFPPGLDANDVASRTSSPNKVLGEHIRKATWLGHGSKPEPPKREPANSDIEAKTTTGSEEVGLNTLSEIAPNIQVSHENESSHDEAANTADDILHLKLPLLPATTTPSPPADIEAIVNDNELVIPIENRRYRVRGLEKNLCYDQLKVNILVNIEDKLHVDSFDLYSAKHRASFIRLAATELRESEETLKGDIGKVILKVEEVQHHLIQTITSPPANKSPVTGSDYKEAMALLKSPDLVAHILSDFQHCGVIGENSNKLVGYLATVSRKLSAPLAIIVQSSSAAGKTALMDAVLSFVPDEEQVHYSAITGQSLYYMGEISVVHKVLAFSEEKGISKAAYALKLLQSEGKLKIASTGKDPNSGRHVALEYFVEGPVMIFTTTTAIDIDEELLNRCLILTVDEDRDQTHAIHDWQRYSETLDGLKEIEQRQNIIRVHKNAQRLLKPLKVVNPYAPLLTFLDDKTRTRRDHTKYLTLIRSIALLHQYQREIKNTYVAGKQVDYIEVSIDDIALANQLAHEVLGRTLDELPPHTRQLLTLIDEMVSKRCGDSHHARSEHRFTRRDVRDYTGWGDTQLKVHLRRLETFEYLLVHRGTRGRLYVYELLYNSEGKYGEPFLMGLIDVDTLRKQCALQPSDGTNHSADTSHPPVGQRSAHGHSPVDTNYVIINKELHQNAPNIPDKEGIPIRSTTHAT